MTTISTNKAPAAVGPYSQAILAGNTLYCAGQIPLDPESGKLLEGDIKAQTTRVLENIKAVLAKAGLGFENIVKAECFLADLNDYAQMNEVYSKYFTDHKPARVALEVSKLPLGAKVEIAVIAVKE